MLSTVSGLLIYLFIFEHFVYPLWSSALQKVSLSSLLHCYFFHGQMQCRYSLSNYDILPCFSSTVCIWATYFLATSKSVQEKLYQEVNQVLGNSPLSFDKLQKLRCVTIFAFKPLFRWCITIEKAKGSSFWLQHTYRWDFVRKGQQFHLELLVFLCTCQLFLLFVTRSQVRPWRRIYNVEICMKMAD